MFVYFLLFTIFSTIIQGNEIHEYTLEEISDLTTKSCLLLTSSSNNSEIFPILQNLTKVFANETSVKIGVLKPEKSYLNKQEDYKANIIAIAEEGKNHLTLYPKKIVDRKCLLQPLRRNTLKKEFYKGSLNTDLILQFLNEQCNTYRDIQGSLNHAGRMRDLILQNLFSVNNGEQSEGKIRIGHNGPVNIGADCERISMPTQEEFIHKYLFRSKPVIITGRLCLNHFEYV